MLGKIDPNGLGVSVIESLQAKEKRIAISLLFSLPPNYKHTNSTML